MYESPIEIIQTGFKAEIEGEILKAVNKYDIFVDKDELIKALSYDRDQYDKGYLDGLLDGGNCLLSCEYCSGAKYTDKPFRVITKLGNVRDVVFNFCPSCGRNLKGE